MSVEFDPVSLLQHLSERNVEFVVVGGFAAWMHGAPVVTMDLDIVYAATPKNVADLVDVLRTLEAHYRHHGDRKLKPTAAGLTSVQAAGHHLLSTSHGNLDLLRTVASLGYDDLAKSSQIIAIADIDYQFAPLEQIISLKEAANRPKDLAALPTLRAALNDSENSEQ